MEKLRDTGLIPVIKKRGISRKAAMGICLGMQMLLEKSYEYGEHEGLGLIKGSVRPMAPDLKARALITRCRIWAGTPLRLRAAAAPY